MGLHYFERAADLAPFVSRDIDILGNRETLEEVAALVKGKPEFFPMRPPTNVPGVVVAHDNEGDPVLIEVLRYAHGIDEEELRNPTHSFVIGKNRIPAKSPPSSDFRFKVFSGMLRQIVTNHHQVRGSTTVRVLRSL